MHTYKCAYTQLHAFLSQNNRIIRVTVTTCRKQKYKCHREKKIFCPHSNRLLVFCLLQSKIPNLML